MSNKKTVRQVISFIKPYRILLLLSISFAVLTSLSMLYVPVLIGEAIDNAREQGLVYFAGIQSILVEIAVIVALYALFQWIMSIVNNRISFQVVRDIRISAFEKLEKLPLKFIDSQAHGDIVNRIISDADQFAEGLLMGFAQLFTGVFTILATLVFMLMINWQIALVVVVFTPLSLLIARFVSKRTFGMFLEQSKTRGEQGALINEMVGNMKIVHAFSRQEQVINDFNEINERLEKVSLRAIFFSSLTNPSTRFVNSMIYSAVALVGAFACMGAGGILTVGQLSILLSYSTQYARPFNEISSVIAELQNALACAGRIFELINEDAEKPEHVDAIVLKDVKGNVAVEGVDFSYVQGKKFIEDFNLSVGVGQRVAIVGPTGCGKTTIINLLLRFYDVDRGKILVDSTDIQKATRESLRSSYGMVLQDTWLKSGTIKENIKMGRPNASDEDVIEAAKASHAHNFIMRLPKGYETSVTNSDNNLSVGQKQLLSIARIMLNLPPMLILDEATSSIDTRTEMRIQSAFARLMENRSSFIVAHRLSTIREADVILVMDNGKIIERGRHEELLEQNGFYANLYNSQFAV